MHNQPTLFGTDTARPEGFRYQPDILSHDKEGELLRRIRELPLRDLAFHGYTGKRRVISFGWQYDFSSVTFRNFRATL